MKLFTIFQTHNNADRWILAGLAKDRKKSPVVCLWKFVDIKVCLISSVLISYIFLKSSNILICSIKENRVLYKYNSMYIMLFCVRLDGLHLAAKVLSFEGDVNTLGFEKTTDSVLNRGDNYPCILCVSSILP